MKDFKGTVIEESLKDKSVLNKFEILESTVTDDVNPADRWHLFTVQGTRDAIKGLLGELNGPQWYCHFWNDEQIIVVFYDKIFEYDRKDFETAKTSAVEHGIELGIPEAQLDFITS